MKEARRPRSVRRKFNRELRRPKVVLGKITTNLRIMMDPRQVAAGRRYALNLALGPRLMMTLAATFAGAAEPALRSRPTR
jgi:hypothetical protein